MTTLQIILKAFALLFWFIGTFTGVWTVRTGNRDGLVTAFNLTCAGLFCWHLADLIH